MAVRARQHVVLDVAEPEVKVLFLDPHQDALFDVDRQRWENKYDRIARKFGLTLPDGYAQYSEVLPLTATAQRREEADAERYAQVDADLRRAVIRWENAPLPRPAVLVEPESRAALSAFLSREQAEAVVSSIGLLFRCRTAPSDQTGEVSLVMHHLPERATVDDLTGRMYAALRAIEEVAGVGAVASVRWPSEG